MQVRHVRVSLREPVECRERGFCSDFSTIRHPGTEIQIVLALAGTKVEDMSWGMLVGTRSVCSGRLTTQEF